MRLTWVRFMVGASCPQFHVELISFQHIHYLAIVRVRAAGYRLQVFTGIQGDKFTW